MSKKLSRLHTRVYNALFRKESKLSYERTLEAIYNLAEEAKRLNIDLDENACDCEGDVTIKDILTGAYNFVLKYHHQDSDWIEDRVLAILDGIALPVDWIELDTSEVEVYNLLLKKKTFTVVEYRDINLLWSLKFFQESESYILEDDYFENYPFRYELSNNGNVVLSGSIDLQSDYDANEDATERIIKHIGNEFQDILFGMAFKTVRKK